MDQFQQPNFERMAASARVLGDELERCVNLPAVSDGSRVVSTFAELLREQLSPLRQSIESMSRRLDTMDQRLDAMDQRFLSIEQRITETGERLEQRIQETEERLKQRIATGEANNLARLANATVTRPDLPITPLLASGGAEIASFPHTLGDIHRLTGPEVNELLAALDQPTSGVVADRRLRLQKCCGIYTQVVV